MGKFIPSRGIDLLSHNKPAKIISRKEGLKNFNKFLAKDDNDLLIIAN